MRFVLRGLYQLATGAALAVAGPFLLARRGGHYLPVLPSRLGRVSGEAAPRGALWLHAVSVGEVGVAATLARVLPAEIPLLVTTITPTGQERARAAFGVFGERAGVDYLPFDLGFAVRRFFERHEPRALVLVEGDYWPLLLHEARLRGLPVAVVNGRVGDRSFRRMGYLKGLLDPLFSAVDRFGVQSTQDRDRLVALGIDPGRITVTGNLKYESPEPPRNPELEEALLRLAGGRPLLLAGSTMAGEEEAVLDAVREIGEALLVLAPRHPERWNDVEALLRSRGTPFARRTALPDAGNPEVVLLDSLGELAGLYRLAAAAFIGGTLVPTGGHNPLEAARFGVPVAVGPSMHNFREMAEAFDRAGAWRRVADARELAAAWRQWLEDPEAARAVGGNALRLVEENRGALARTIGMLEPILSSMKGTA